MLDYWITSKSKFLISTITGLDEIGTVEKIPTLYFGLTDLIQAPQYRICLIQPSYLFWKKSKKPLTLLQRFETELGLNHYLKEDIMIKHCEESYLSATYEFFDIFSKGFARCKKIENLQKKFWLIFKYFKNNKKIYVNKNAFISSKFLLDYESDILEF